MVLYLNVIIFLVIIVFLVFFCIFLTKGENIYELLIHSNVNFIYDKMEKDFQRSLDKENKTKNLVFAVNNNYIYKTTNTQLNYIALLNQFHIGDHILDINKDDSKIIPLISNLNSKFSYEPFNINVNIKQ